MKANELAALIGMGVDEAIAEIDRVYTVGPSAEDVMKTRVLGASLNNSYDPRLQPALQRWIQQPLPENDDGSWRQLSAFWMALYKEKTTLEYTDPVLVQFSRLVTAYAKLAEQGVDNRTLFLRIESIERAETVETLNNGLLDLSAMYYLTVGPKSCLSKEHYRVQMARTFQLITLSSELTPDPSVLAIHAVHTEGIEGWDLHNVHSQMHATNIGWFSWWHLFQVSNEMLQRLNHTRVHCSAETMRVFSALCDVRLQ